jgi:hypothetical protein
MYTQIFSRPKSQKRIEEDHMGDISLNWAAIIVCALLNMVVGSLWYNPKTFFPAWWKGIGKTTGDVPGSGSMPILWVLTVLSAVVQVVFMAIAVAVVGKAIGGTSFVSGALVGLVLSIGLLAPTYLVNKLFAGHGFKVWAIEVGNHLIDLVLIGAILGAWR